jgi:hypothetical protein
MIFVSLVAIWFFATILNFIAWALYRDGDGAPAIKSVNHDEEYERIRKQLAGNDIDVSNGAAFGNNPALGINTWSAAAMIYDQARMQEKARFSRLGHQQQTFLAQYGIEA